MDTFPPYLLQQNGVLIPNLFDPAQPGRHLASIENPMYALAWVLHKSGYDYLPTARKIVLDIGLVFEDYIVKCQVTDGLESDKEMFSCSVVNYPVENYAPLIEEIKDQDFEVGRLNTYQVLAHDPDLADMMAGLRYEAMVSGHVSYQLPPSKEAIIDPDTGLLAFIPLNEGILTCDLTVTDDRGMWAISQFEATNLRRDTL